MSHTWKAGEEIYEVAGKASGMSLDGMYEACDRASEELADGVYGACFAVVL